MGARWIDLVDPTRDEVEAVLPVGTDPDVLEDLLAAPRRHEPRPLLEDHGSYVVGVFVPFATVEGQPVPLEVCVVATGDRLVTVRKSGPSGATFDVDTVAAADEAGRPVGELVHRLVDDVVDTYLDLLDAIFGQIDDLEDRIDELRPDVVQERHAELRRDLLNRRRTVSATRVSVRRIVDGRIEAGDPELFPLPIERMFADTYDTLVRIGEEIDVARDLLSGVRDHLQSKIAQNQNEIGKKLTVIASLVLVPSFVVGFFGQNFAGEFERGYWTIAVSTGVIVGSTLAQLALFRWRRWI
jgi:magnesium transporter